MSTNTQFCLRWESYKQNFSGGFFQLQQDEELVDMTLAADGHLVKVHKTLLALASPYFKEIVRSVNSHQYPVLYLSDVNKETLQYILQYIYDGEVNIDKAKLPNFIKAAKALQIKGVDSINIPPSLDQHRTEPVSIPAPCSTNIAANIEIFSDKHVQKIHVQNLNNDSTKEKAYYDYPILINPNPTDICQLEENMKNDLASNFNQYNSDLGDVDVSTAVIANPVNVHLNINQDQQICQLEEMKSVDLVSDFKQYNSDYGDVDASTYAIANPVNVHLSKEQDICQLEEMKSKDSLSNFKQYNLDFRDFDVLTDVTAKPVNVHLNINQDGHVDIISNTNVSDDFNTDDYTMETSTTVTNDEPVTSEFRQVTKSFPQDSPVIDVTKLSDQIKYSISNRGSIQIVINDFMYRPHHSSKVRGVTICRWRCISYRAKACKAYLDTHDGIFKTGYLEHSHASHAPLVWKKQSRRNVYRTMQEAILKAADMH